MDAVRSSDPAADPAQAADDLRRYGETVAFRMLRSRRLAALTVFPGVAVMFVGGTVLGWVTGTPLLFLACGIAAVITVGNAVSEFLPALRDEPVVTVGPDGIRLRSVGLVSWDAIDRIELEAVKGFAGHGDDEPPVAATYRRIGVRTRDPAAGRRRLNPLARWAVDQAGVAPLGVYAFMLDAPLEDVVERIRLYMDVAEPAGA